MGNIRLKGLWARAATEWSSRSPRRQEVCQILPVLHRLLPGDGEWLPLGPVYGVMLLPPAVGYVDAWPQLFLEVEEVRLVVVPQEVGQERNPQGVRRGSQAR